MPFAVVLPKVVAIQNRRLAFLHFTMVITLLLTLFYTKVIVSHEHLGVAHMNSDLEMKWDEMQSIADMGKFLMTYPGAQAVCDVAEVANETWQRWGHNWTRKTSCAKFCNLDDYLAHTTWRDNLSPLQQQQSACWSSFKDYGMGMRYTAVQFMESRGPRDVSMITSKNDWHVDQISQTKTNFLEMVPQSKVAVLDLGYTYELASRPPWFPGSSQHQGPSGGSQRDARTLILDAKGKPIGDPIPPGDIIKLKVDDVWRYAHGPHADEGGSLPKEILASGAEIRAMAACFGDDRYLLEYISEHNEGDPLTKGYGATLEDLVCVIRFEIVSSSYQIYQTFVAPLQMQGDYSQEVLSETTGISIKVIKATTFVEIRDFNTLLLQLTSVLVLLAIPMEITTFITTRLLGPLSSMYRRMLCEPYCIEEVASMTSTVLAQNVASFYKLSNEDEDGVDTIKLPGIQVLMQKAFANRKDEIGEAELLSLSSFLYKGIMKKQPRNSPDGIKAAVLSCLFDIESGGAAEGEGSARNGITLDQWNQCRLDCEKITFEALVKLFDKDRRRSMLEIWFTPSKISDALISAMTPEEQARSHLHHMHSSHHLPAESEMACQSSSLTAKLCQSSSSVGLKTDKYQSTVHVPAEVAELSERVNVLEEDMREHDRVAKSGVPERVLLESRELHEAFTLTLPALAEKVTAMESSVSSLVEDVGGLVTPSMCEVCDGSWASAILRSFPPDVMQELDDVRGGISSLATWISCDIEYEAMSKQVALSAPLAVCEGTTVLDSAKKKKQDAVLAVARKKLDQQREEEKVRRSVKISVAPSTPSAKAGAKGQGEVSDIGCV